MKVIDLIKLKIACENFIDDKMSDDDVKILANNGYIDTVESNGKLVFVYPSKDDLRKVIQKINSKL